MKNKTGKRIPISWAKKLANELGYSQVVIHAYDGETGMQRVCTYGKTIDDCENAARGGNTIKKLLGWPEELCNAKPRRSIPKKEKLKEGNIITNSKEPAKSLKPIIDSMPQKPKEKI